MTAPTSQGVRSSATPLEIDRFLRAHFAEDVVLAYQRAIGARAVAEAARDQRMHAAGIQLAEGVAAADQVRRLADLIDPGKRGSMGPYPAQLIDWSAP